MKYYTDVLKKYAVFSGRATRKEYWMFILFNFIIGFIIGIITGVIKAFTELDLTTIVSGVYSLAILIPSIAVAARRMHDVDKSALFMLIPVYGFILLFINGTKGANKFGPDPKEIVTIPNPQVQTNQI